MVEDGVESLIDAFRDCSELRYVTLPQTLETIEQQAFEGCPVDSVLKTTAESAGYLHKINPWKDAFSACFFVLLHAQSSLLHVPRTDLRGSSTDIDPVKIFMDKIGLPFMMELYSRNSDDNEFFQILRQNNSAVNTGKYEFMIDDSRNDD